MIRGASLLAAVGAAHGFGTLCQRAPPAPRREAACCASCCTSFCSPKSGQCHMEWEKDYYEPCAEKPKDWVAPCCSGCADGEFCSSSSGKCYPSQSKQRYCLCGTPPPLPPVHPEIKPSDVIPAGTRAAFLGDAGHSEAQAKVLQMVKDWGAEFVVHGGDFEYDDDAALFEKNLDAVLGPDYPYFADIGNHDVPAWTGQPGGGHKERLEARLRRFGGDKHCAGEYGVNMVCNWKGLTFVLSGVGTYGISHVDYINKAFEANPTPWRMCNWHKNQRLMQVGGKSDEVGWGAYEACRENGAILATHHEHSYCRSKNLKVTGPDPEVANEDKTMVMFPGQSFVFVSGLAGKSIRVYKDGLQNNPWWASHAAAEDSVDYGAVLCVFHVNGNPHEAECEFKDVTGKVWDRWTMVTKNGNRKRSNSNATQVPQVVDVPAIADFAVDTDGRRVRASDSVVALEDGAGFTFGTTAFRGARRVRQAHLQVYGAEEGLPHGNVTICGQKRDGTLTSTCAEWSDATQQDEFGDKHEVWVSPDLKAVVEELLGEDTLTLVTRGPGPRRAVYTSDHSACMTPHLWVEL